MVTLNDYLYSGDTVFKIIQNYMTDLRKEAKRTHNEIDLVHSNCLLQVQEMLEHNDFLTSQSQKIREFYKYMAKEFPFLAFTFRGRIKSLIRTEEKFNGYIVEYIYNYYEEHGTYPAVADLKEKLSCFRDIIAYRIVIALPKCHLKPGQNLEEEEMKYLYQIANALPGFLEERGFTAEPAKGVRESNRLSTRSESSVSISDSPYCKSSHGCFTCMENRLSLIKSTLSFPLLLESGSTIFVPSDNAELLISAEKSLILLI